MNVSSVQRFIRISLTVVFFGWLAACGSATEADSAPAVTKTLPDSIAASEVAEYSGMQFLDVRTHGEWNAGHIEGALHLPVSDIDPESAANLPKGQPLLVYCASGGRASRAVVTLRELGFKAVAVRDGGFSELKKQLPATL